MRNDRSLTRRLAVAVAALGVTAGAAAAAVGLHAAPAPRADDPYGPWACVAYGYVYGVCVYPPVQFHAIPA